jgi:hypothetical protein
MTTGQGDAKKRALACVTSVPVVSSVTRKAPAMSGMALSMSSPVMSPFAEPAFAAALIFGGVDFPA